MKVDMDSRSARFSQEWPSTTWSAVLTLGIVGGSAVSRALSDEIGVGDIIAMRFVGVLLEVASLGPPNGVAGILMLMIAESLAVFPFTLGVQALMMKLKVPFEYSLLLTAAFLVAVVLTCFSGGLPIS